MAATNIGIKNPLPGSITFTQRWGSACNLNRHLHTLCLDGVFSEVSASDGSEDAKRMKFSNVPTLTDLDTENILKAITTKVMKHLQKKGYLSPEGDVAQNPELAR
ncbi:MAG: transposase [Proteobacteria bacterium]|nr:transposase [Pseudomonadota bacterium]